MTKLELLTECLESEDSGLGNPGFRVVLPGLFKTKRVRIDRGLYGENLGHYPNVFESELTTTHIFLKCSDVRRYLKRYG